MPVFKGSRYNKANTVEIVENNTKKIFVGSPQELDKEALKNDYVIYVTRERDELDSIAFSSGIVPQQWWIIADLNDVFFAFDVKPLQRLVVPNIEILDRI